MKIVFLHGLGQRAADWDQVACQFPNTDCPDLFEIAGEKPLWFCWGPETGHPGC